MFYRIGKVNMFTPNKGEFPQKLTEIELNKMKNTAKQVDFEEKYNEIR